MAKAHTFRFIEVESIVGARAPPFGCSLDKELIGPGTARFAYHCCQIVVLLLGWESLLRFLFSFSGTPDSKQGTSVFGSLCKSLF